MRSITTLHRLLGGAAFVAVLSGGLLVAERGSSPEPVNVDAQSIAASFPAIPRLPTLPTFTPRVAAPSLPLPSVTNIPGLPRLGGDPGVTPQDHFFVPTDVPGNEAICAGLNNTRKALLDSPPSLARDAALALNAFHLSVFHCIAISQ